MSVFVDPTSLHSTEIVGVGWAARALKVGEATVRRLSDSGQLRALRLETGQRCFIRSEVEALAVERAKK